MDCLRRLSKTLLPMFAVASATIVTIAQLAAADKTQADHFEEKIRPLLVKYCAECHGESEPENELRLDNVEGIARGGRTAPAIVSGEPDKSLIVQAVRYTSKLKMPPDKRLSAEDIALLERWIRDGAVLPGTTVPVRSGRSGNKPLITEEDRAWWAFQPLQQPVLPEVRAELRVRTAVDRFVLSKLEERGLSMSPDADRRTLIRRLSFDLIGLPPTPEEVDAFLRDERPNAYERLVDRLLASPQYGVRWGRHWLDVARYADTNGGGFDYVYPNAWRYRDYVVRAMNYDKPYDQFLVEQLAGDLLPVGDDEDAYVERLQATGLLTLAPKGLGMQDKEQMALDVVDDQIDVLGRSLMGLTLSCARCHDHKFDPIPTADYYSLAGIFHSTTSVIDTNKNPSYWPEKPLELPSVTAARAAFKSRKAANEKAIAEVKKKAGEAVLADARQRVSEYLFAASRINAARKEVGAIAHWSFDASDGDAVHPNVGPEGALANVKSDQSSRPIRSNGRQGRALRFAGKGDVVAMNVDQLAPIDFGKATNFTLSLWLRAGDGYSPKTADTLIAANYASGAMWFVAMRPGAYNGIYLRHYDGKRAVDIKPAKNHLPLLTDNEWHHVVFCSDRDGNGVVYIDGKMAGEIVIAPVSSEAQFSDASRFLVGASTNQFRGDLDEVAIWNRLLTAREIRTLAHPATQIDRTESGSDQTSGRREARTTTDRLSYEDAARSGLLPSIVRRTADLLTMAEDDAESPLRALVDSPPKSLENVTAFVARAGTSLQQLLDDEKSTPFMAPADFSRFYDESTKEKLAKLAAEMQDITRVQVEEPTMAMVAFDTSRPSDLRVHVAGDRMRLGELAPRGFPRIIRVNSETVETKSGRLELARWLTSPDHPLTSRVFVNRVWQHHFGIGLVGTPDNFGRLGERPSHPELLDWLARRLIDSDWSVKQSHRDILLSSTYRQSSAMREDAYLVDSGNRLLWRTNRRRLEGEPLRDAMLAVSGQIDLQLNGTVNDWKPRMFSADDANNETANYNTQRRSIYLPVVRGAAVHEMLQLFDFGDPNSITARRDVTTIAPQALFLMNSPFVNEQAKHFADRLTNEVGAAAPQRIQLAYELTLSRSPTETELKRAIEFVGENDLKSWERLCQLLLCLNEFAYVD